MSRLGNATLDQVGATAPATAVTLAALAVMGSHHAPAAATAVLVSSSIAPPGRALYGLTGQALVVILAPVLARPQVSARRPSRWRTEQESHHLGRPSV